jgi:structure-specific recognition protein 1
LIFQEFHKLVLDKADVVSTTGGGLATFPQIPVLTPRHASFLSLSPSPFLFFPSPFSLTRASHRRGRYDVEIFPSFLRLHGKTYDYKIMYSSISHIFELPKPDDRHVCLMVNILNN